MDLIAHLHPRQTAGGQFDQTLPSMPAGRYRMFADTCTALIGTEIGEVTLPDIVSGLPLDDDSSPRSRWWTGRDGVPRSMYCMQW
jgi:hypothetical protein